MRRALAFAAALFVAVHAHAQPTAEELDAARKTFDQALHLEDQRRYVDALDLFRRVATVKASPQVRFHLAFCLHKLGKLVDAAHELDLARDAAAALGPAGEPIVARATADRNELYAATPRLSVKRVDGSRPPSILLDGATVSLGDDPVAIDPGRHRVVVDRPGKSPFVAEVSVVERTPAMVAEVLVTEPGLRLSPYGFVGAGLTIATFGVAVVTGVMQLSLANKLDGACGPAHDQCPPADAGDIDTAKTLTTATNALIVAGVVEAVATAVLFLTTAPRRTRVHEAAFSITPFGVRGVF